MRSLLLVTLLLALAAPGWAQDEPKPALNDAVVTELRGALSAKRDEERDQAIAKVLGRPDLDYASVKEALMKGPFHQKPLVTAYGERHSGKHLGIRLTGKDSKERGFSYFVPKAYDAEKGFPLIVYLHHGATQEQLGRGADAAAVAVTKFKSTCDDYDLFFMAPYTSKGAEWWTPEGRRLVEWSIVQMKRHYNIDDNRIALVGALDGADAVWYLAQEMPGTFSALMPMTGDPYEISGMVEPLCLGTLDRMDVLMGVPWKTRSQVGEKNALQFLAGLKPMFEQGMRIQTAVFRRSEGDFQYLDDIKDRIAGFAAERQRKPLADEVDVATTRSEGLRSLWLVNHGYDKDGEVAANFPTTMLPFDRNLPEEPHKKIGVDLANLSWEVGVKVNRAEGAAQQNNLFPGDIVLEVDGIPVNKAGEIPPLIDKHDWEDEVHLLLAREVKESELERERRNQAVYVKIRARIAELKKAGKPIPSMRDLRASFVEEDESEADEDEDEEVSIEIGGDPKPADDGGGKPGRGRKREKTVVFVFERWIRLAKPAVPLVHPGFGLSQDHSFGHQGVRVSFVYPGSLADRSGFKPGDVIQQVGDTEVKNSHDILGWFSTFKFEKEPENERFVDFTVRPFEHDQFGAERTVRVVWEPVDVTRVDAKWNRKDDSCHVLTRHSSGFTIYFADEILKPGQDWYLFINGVPYQDLVDPATAPDYPRGGPHADAMIGDRIYRMMRARAKVPGWTADPRLAISDFLANWDRELVVGAKMSVDLTKLREGFRKARERASDDRGAERRDRVQRAYKEHKSQG